MVECLWWEVRVRHGGELQPGDIASPCLYIVGFGAIPQAGATWLEPLQGVTPTERSPRKIAGLASAPRPELQIPPSTSSETKLSFRSMRGCEVKPRCCDCAGRHTGNLQD